MPHATLAQNDTLTARLDSDHKAKSTEPTFHADEIASLTAKLTRQARRNLGLGNHLLSPHGLELTQAFFRPLNDGSGPLTERDIQSGIDGVRKKTDLLKCLLENKVTLLDGFGTQELGMPVNWFHAPKGDWQWPTHLSRHYWLAPLAFAWRDTGNLVYAEKIIEILLQWISETPLHSPLLENASGAWARHHAEAGSIPQTKEGFFRGYADGPWTALSAHARMCWWTRIFQLIWDSPVMTNAVVARFLSSLITDHLSIMVDYPRQMNQFLGIASSLIEYGLYYRQFEKAIDAERIGWRRLEFYATNEIYPDGSVAECSPNYGIGCVDSVQRLLDQGERYGRVVPPLLRERVRLATRYYAMISNPNCCTPRIAKGGDLVADRLASLNKTVGDPEVQYVSSRGKTGHEPEKLCYSYAWAGHNVFRSGWDTEATWLFFESGPRGTGHHDLAQLSVQLMSKGEWLLVDPGFYSYAKDGVAGEYTMYFRSTSAHNTALVDGYGQVNSAYGKTLHPNSTKGDYGWKDDGTVARAEGVYRDGYNEAADGLILHKRSVTYFREKNAFQIEDEFIGSGSHSIDLHWHLYPGVQAQLTENGITITGKKTVMRLDTQSESPLKFSAFTGSRNPLLGWYSESYGKLEAATTIKVGTQGMVPLKIISTLQIE